MDKQNVMQISLAIHGIAMAVSAEDLKKIDKYLKQIESAVLAEIKEEK